MWAELPQDILLKVFMCLSMVDLVVGVSHTCSSWRSVSKNPALWETIDLNAARTNITDRPHTWSDEPSAFRVIGLLKCALKLSCGVTSSLIFDFDGQVGADDLIFAATRTPKLTSLFLPPLTLENLGGFVEAAKHWTGLEAITVQRVEDYTVMLKALGDNCKSLSHLKLVSIFPLGFAEGLCSHLPQLKAVSLRYTLVYTEAVVHLLRALRGLEGLNLSHVLMVDFVERNGAESKIALHQELDGEVVALASRLKAFVTCMGGPCEKCSGPRDSLRELIAWRHSKREGWRFGEEEASGSRT